MNSADIASLATSVAAIISSAYAIWKVLRHLRPGGGHAQAAPSGKPGGTPSGK